METLTILEAAGVDGAYVCTFVEPLSTFDEHPHCDLDMSSLGLVRMLGHGTSITHPGMPWNRRHRFEMWPTSTGLTLTRLALWPFLEGGGLLVGV